MKRGNVVRMTTFTDCPNPHARLTYRDPDKKKVFVFVLLGMENKDGTEPLDAMQALRDMGWTENTAKPRAKKP